MSTHVNNTVGKCCNNYDYHFGMKIDPYLVHTYYADAMPPRVKAYSGWSSYKNVKSGYYNTPHF